jgi:hypothetical protein
MIDLMGLIALHSVVPLAGAGTGSQAGYSTNFENYGGANGEVSSNSVGNVQNYDWFSRRLSDLEITLRTRCGQWISPIISSSRGSRWLRENLLVARLSPPTSLTRSPKSLNQNYAKLTVGSMAPTKFPSCRPTCMVPRRAASERVAYCTAIQRPNRPQARVQASVYPGKPDPRRRHLVKCFQENCRAGQARICRAQSGEAIMTIRGSPPMLRIARYLFGESATLGIVARDSHVTGRPLSFELCLFGNTNLRL